MVGTRLGRLRATAAKLGSYAARRRWAFVAAAAAMLVVVAGFAGIVDNAGSATALATNVKVVKAEFFVSNGATRNSVAKCPSGTKVMSGGFASTGVHARVFVAGPSRSENGYILYAYTPPVNINTGVGKETAKITIIAYCAPVGQPAVFG